METIKLPNIARYKLTLSPEQAMPLNEYTGSAWRGLLGHGLRRVSCLTRMKHCDNCQLQQQCVYSQIFETRAAEGGRFQSKPHPFVIEAPARGRRVIAAGDSLDIGLILFGQAQSSLPFLIQAIRESGQRGLGKTHVPFSLVSARQEARLGADTWQEIYDAEQRELHGVSTSPLIIPAVPEQAIITIETPMRIKQKGRLVGPREFAPDVFSRQLYRRCQDLSHFYGEDSEHLHTKLSLPVTRSQQAAQSHSRVQWQDWTRYSSRQQTRMQMGGITGVLSLDGEILAHWWPLLWYGQWLHLGKATSMGLGQYRILPAQKADQESWSDAA